MFSVGRQSNRRAEETAMDIKTWVAAEQCSSYHIPEARPTPQRKNAKPILAIPSLLAFSWLFSAHASVIEALRAQAPKPVASEERLQSDAPPALRKQLHDPKPAVRLQAALALVREQDLEAIAVLIDLLAELNSDQRKPA